MPAAVIESGTLPGERISRGVVAGLATLGAGGAGGPVLVVVGVTVALAEALAPPRPRAAARPACRKDPGA
jgi:siroheme synthase